jgi:hypothetical protein
MRLEINISDDRPEARKLASLSDPSAYILDLVRRDRGIQPSGSRSEQAIYEDIFAEARNCPSAFNTAEEVDQYIEQLRNEW